VSGRDLSDATHTVDGVEITPGLWVWDYDLLSVQIDPEQFPGGRRHSPITGVGAEHWDGWYDTVKPDGTRGGIMNGTRMVAVFEGLRAADYQGMTYGEAKKKSAG
jgi:hypothetical protein